MPVLLGQTTLDTVTPASAQTRAASARELDVGRQAPAPITSIPEGSHFGDVRANGVRHFGIDIPVAPTASVAAPEQMTITHVWRDNATAPFVGYGPGGVLAKGVDSGRYHLLAHMDPSTFVSSAASGADAIAVGQVFAKGELIGQPAAGGEGLGRAQPHVHWEVRIQPIDSPSTRAGNTLDPIQWLAGLDVRPSDSRSPDGTFWLIVLALFAFSRRRN